jgi:hypothetical protein
MTTLPRDTYAPTLRTAADVSAWFDRMVAADIIHHPDDSAYAWPHLRTGAYGWKDGDDGRMITGGWFDTAPLLHLARHDRAMDRAHELTSARGWDIYRMVWRALRRAGKDV